MYFSIFITHPDMIVEENNFPSSLTASDLKEEQKSRIEKNLIKVLMVSSKITTDISIHRLELKLNAITNYYRTDRFKLFLYEFEIEYTSLWNTRSKE